MINLKNLQLKRGNRVIIDQADCTIHVRQKIGVTGANGAGKSSLFALILGELEPELGELEISGTQVIAHVAQETPPVDMTAIEYVMDGDAGLRDLQRQLTLAETGGDGEKIAHLHDQLAAIDGYSAPARAAKLLNGLGFQAGQENSIVKSFSGGWRMRLNLAQALMCRSDILLLDEPTNHLDLDAVIWLQEWLKTYPGTLLLISHDREFLDEITNHILHLEHKTLTLYTGNYSGFERYRAEKIQQQQAAFEKQAAEVAHIQSFVDRFRAKATKAKQVQSRLKALEKIEMIAAVQVDSPFHFQFRQPDKQPDLLVSLGNVALGYGKEPVLEKVKLTLTTGDRFALIGPNGAGKSTLIKYLAGEVAALNGDRTDAEHIKIGYFAQHQLEQLNLDESPLQHLKRIDPQATEKELRNFLGGFDFTGDRALDIVRPFSGGEKARLVLALLVYSKPNVLLLDEPTNHLDIGMRHALSVALQDFAGAVVVVSHDRHLLRSVADQLFLVAGGKVQPFDGDLDDYRRWLLDDRKEQASSESDANQLKTDNETGNRKEQRQRDAELRKKLQPLRNKIKKMEADLEKLHSKQEQLDGLLAAPSLYDESEKKRLVDLIKEKSDLDQQVNSLEEEWMLAHETLEQAGI